MINKLMKYLFGEKEIIREEDPSIPKATEEEKDPLHNVGEPVISFVKNFDEKNFTFEKNWCDNSCGVVVKVKDKRNGEEFSYIESVYGEVFLSTLSFLTIEEKHYIKENLIKPVRKRRYAIKRKRKKLKEERERRRLKKLYCEESK